MNEKDKTTRNDVSKNKRSLEQIPIKFDSNSQLREFVSFIKSKGYKLLHCDISNVRIPSIPTTSASSSNRSGVFGVLPAHLSLRFPPFGLKSPCYKVYPCWFRVP